MNITNKSKILETLLTDYGSLVDSIVFKYCNNREEAKDLSGNIWEKVFKGLDTFKEGKDYAPWISIVARNNCIDWLRKKHPLSSHDQLSEIEVCKGEFPEDSDKENTELLKKTLAGLHEKERNILVFHHIEGLSLKITAKKLGISESAAKSLLYRARIELRNALKKLNYN